VETSIDHFLSFFWSYDRVVASSLAPACGVHSFSNMYTLHKITQILARLTFGRPQADAIRAQEAARAARAEAKKTQASSEEARVKAAEIATALEEEAKRTAAAGLILMKGKH